MFNWCLMTAQPDSKGDSLVAFAVDMVCVCVNLTSRGEETLAIPAYQGGLARIPPPMCCY